jgi:site-specific DNA-methyltransferase (adenine-specific)
MVCAFFVKISADASEEQRSLFNFTDTDTRTNLYKYQSCQRLVKVSGENTSGNVTLNPCQKPMRLLIELIEKFSKPGDMILDLCSGTGTTAVACAVTNRSCTSLETDELQWRLIPRRWQSAKGYCDEHVATDTGRSSLHTTSTDRVGKVVVKPYELYVLQIIFM